MTDELNDLGEYLYNNESVTGAIDDILSYLILAYQTGIADVGEQLEEDIEVNTDSMQSAIYTEIDGKTFEDRVRTHFENENVGALQNLIESEYHRVYTQAMDDGAMWVSEELNRHVNKTWYTMGDEWVRDNHAYLNGMQIGMLEEFYTPDGDHAPHPGRFEKAENNALCRCILIYNVEPY